MATPPTPGPASSPDPAAPARRLLAGARSVFLLALLAVLVACLAFSWTTRDAMTNLPFLRSQNQLDNFSDNQKTLVDLHSWQTAQALAPLAVSTEEVEFAREAERLADHDGDQAFAAALRQASTLSRKLTGPALALSQRVAQLQQIVKQDQAQVQSLTAARPPAAASAGDVQTTPAVDDLQIAKAQLGLDSDELTDAQQELARVSGDKRARIQQELAAHESVMRSYDEQARNGGQVAVLSAQQYNTLAQRLRAWQSQRSRRVLVQRAMQQAQADATALTAQLAALQPVANSASTTSSSNTERLANIKNRSEQRQLLSIYDDRIQTQHQLATVYAKWSAQLSLQHRIILHLILQSVALIAFVLICVTLSTWAVHRFLENRKLSRPNLDRRGTDTLSKILRLAIEILGVVIILLIVFGAPRQTPTILGLATAGLTVVMQDFIISFFGWFVLMGKNGIRVGDSVEINSVGGEVASIGLFRTVMLETGNWTDTGHPTGRRITFMNKFAISGQYFNFSTTGQWMWDEITLSVPASADTYATIDALHQAVLQATAEDVKQAEQEWKRSPRQHGLSQLTPTPSVNLRPAASGVEIVVRYVTRASSRFETRNRLYQCVVDVLRKSSGQPAGK